MPSSRITSLLEGLQFTPPSTARTNVDDTRYYVHTYLVRRLHQHFLSDFPFHEIYRRLFVFTHGRMYNTLWYQVRVMCQMRMIRGTHSIAICLFERGWWYAWERGWWYAWHLRSDQQTGVSLVGGGTHDPYVPPKEQLYRRGYPMKSHPAADARQNTPYVSNMIQRVSFCIY